MYLEPTDKEFSLFRFIYKNYKYGNTINMGNYFSSSQEFEGIV